MSTGKADEPSGHYCIMGLIDPLHDRPEPMADYASDRVEPVYQDRVAVMAASEYIGEARNLLELSYRLRVSILETERLMAANGLPCVTNERGNYSRPIRPPLRVR